MDEVVKAATPEEIARADEKAKGQVKESPVPEQEDDEDVEYLSDGMETKSHTLRVPMKYKGVEYRDVTINPMFGEDFRKLAATTQFHAYEIAVIMTLTGLPVKVVKRMRGEDFADILEICKGFLPQQFQGSTDEQTGDDGPNT